MRFTKVSKTLRFWSLSGECATHPLMEQFIQAAFHCLRPARISLGPQLRAPLPEMNCFVQERLQRQHPLHPRLRVQQALWRSRN
jgi:hypothetical protein